MAQWSRDIVRCYFKGYYLEEPLKYIRDKKNEKYELQKIIFKRVKRLILKSKETDYVSIEVRKYNDYMLLYMLGPKRITIKSRGI